MSQSAASAATLPARLPQFSQIDINNIPAQLKARLDENRQAIAKLLAQSEPFTWDNLLRPLELLDVAVHTLFSPIGHLHSVVNSDPLRDIYQQCLPLLADYSTEISQNATLYQAIQSVADSAAYQTLDAAQQAVITHTLRDFILSGVHLPTDKKKQFAELSKALSELTTQFENNVLDATQGWFQHVTDTAELSGLPEHAIELAKDTAKRKDLTGYVFTLDIPSYLPVMMYAESSALREAMYQAYVTRASDQGPQAGQWDNSQVMADILSKRTERAKLLDFPHYAGHSLATKMAASTEEVLQFLMGLVNASLEKAKLEYQELSAFARETLGIASLQPWDVAYASEQLRRHRYDISPEVLRPYFPEDKVIQGLFAIVKKLFNVDIVEQSGVDTWHPDVRFFNIYRANGELQSGIYLDLYARDKKRGGAWMDDCLMRHRLANGDMQQPVAYVVCNFDRPVGDKPALWTHSDVVTLFHEVGHSLQHMLTTVDYSDVSGINGIPWDAVEIASQFLENWAWSRESIDLISGHYETGESLPEDLYNKMWAARNFQSALQMMRQLEFSLFDFNLHMTSTTDQSKRVGQIQAILDSVRAQVSVTPIAEYNRFQHSFSHVFAGGYAAGYYSYKWAEVIAADAFSAFEEQGIFDPETSQRFRECFLESGGVPDPMDVFIRFRGRKPSEAALLRQSGIQEAVERS